MTTTTLWAAATLATCALVSACGSSDSNTTNGSNTGATRDGIVVLDENDAAITGAIVVVDRADGSQEQQTTNEHGVATFSDVDFASETLDVTAFSPGRVLVTALGVGPNDGRTLHLRPLERSALWTRVLALQISNKVASGDEVTVTATTPSIRAGTAESALQFPIAPGRSGKILAIEDSPASGTDTLSSIKAAVVADIPASSDSIGIDFAKSMPVEHASGTLKVPSGAERCSVWLSASGATANVSDSWSAANGVCNWQTDYFRPFPDSSALTVFDVGVDAKNIYDTVGFALPGYFPATAPPALPEPVHYAAGAGGASTPSVFAPIAWEAGADRPDRLVISASLDKVLFPVWSVSFPPGRDSVTLRKPPDSIWNAIDWKNASDALPVLRYCDPGPAQCGGRACEPGDDPVCVRYAFAFPMVSFSFQPN